jgi:hypothetical protein
MEQIYYLITATLSKIRMWLGLVLPVFAKVGDFRHWSPWVWRILHLLAVGGVLYLTWWLNRVYDVGYFLQGVDIQYRQFFLPVLFLLVYTLSWLGYWLWRLFGEEEAAADFPDVDAAWREAVRKLDAAGIGLADAPLFLILGRPAAGDDALFQAAQVSTTVRAPAAPEAPLRVYAHRDAIYVTCSGASAWGRMAAMLAGEVEPDAGGPAEAPAAAGIGKTIKFGEQMGLAPELVDEMRALLTQREQRDLTPEESDRLRELAELTKGPATAQRRARMSPEEQARETARLGFLCRLIRRDRSPWCPVNGVLALVPWAATESDESAKEAITVLQRELGAAREYLQLRCPVYALVCDMETARGFAEFRRGLPPDMLKSRVGQRLPLAPDLPNAEVPGLWERGVQWVGESVLPVGILKFLRLDAPTDPRKTPLQAGMHNRNLYMLLSQVYARGPRLAKVLARGLGAAGESSDAPDALPLFGGCYLGGTGRQPQDQAFVPGVFARLTDGQNHVSWTNQALAEDAKYRRWTALGYAIILVALVVAGAGVWWWKQH